MFSFAGRSASTGVAFVTDVRKRTQSILLSVIFLLFFVEVHAAPLGNPFDLRLTSFPDFQIEKSSPRSFALSESLR